MARREEEHQTINIAPQNLFEPRRDEPMMESCFYTGRKCIQWKLSRSRELSASFAAR
jgi:hypothetical protein